MNGCNPATLNPKRSCTSSVDNAKGSIVILGDSNAGQFAEPVTRAGNQLGYDVTVGSVGGCWFADIEGDWEPSATCRRFVTDSIATMQQSPPDLVIVADSTTFAMTPTSDADLTDPRSGQTSKTLDDRLKIYEDGLTSVLQQLAAANIPTVVVHTIPDLGNDGSWIAATCPSLRIYLGSCDASISRPAVEDQQRFAREAEDQAVAQVPLASAVDFTQEICSPDRCSAERDGVWMYRDATHLSVQGALSLTDEFRTLIADHVREPS
jgi:hypothetical protein